MVVICIRQHLINNLALENNERQAETGAGSMPQAPGIGLILSYNLKGSLITSKVAVVIMVVNTLVMVAR